MGPVRAISTGFRKSLTFSGRASRSEFWWFAPLWTVTIFGALLTESPRFLFRELLNKLSVLQILLMFLIVLLIPVFAAMWRRMNDTRIPTYLLLLIPIWILIAPPLAYFIDQSETSGFYSPARMMPEAMYVFFGYAALITGGFILALFPSPTTADNGPNPNEVPS